MTGPGRIVAVTGGKGGPGATTLAVGLAAALAERGGGKVLLVDLDPAGGDVTAHVSACVDTRRGLLPLASVTGPSLTPADLASECVAVAPGLWVLAGLPWPDTRRLLTAELIRNLLERARQLADLVVVDPGRLTAGAPAVQVVASAEVGLLAVRPDLPGALAASRALDALPDPPAGGWLGLVALVVLPRGHREVAALGRALEVPVLGIVPADVEGARRVVASGRPPRRGRLADAYADLAEALLADVLPAATDADASHQHQHQHEPDLDPPDRSPSTFVAQAPGLRSAAF